jgi:hypothetical protein
VVNLEDTQVLGSQDIDDYFAEHGKK